jgi:SAM-dependent methyltransferase
MLNFRERLSTRAWIPQWLRHQHVGRYKWVARWVSGKRVIDAACGTGYGAFALAKGGTSLVTGFDISVAAIDEARTIYQASNLNFRMADIRQLPVPDASVDAFVSFETIEHLQRPTEYLGEVARVLVPGGLFFCSTPNRVLTSPGLQLADRPLNPHHWREYSAEEFRCELAPYFSAVELWCQSIYSPGYSRLLGMLGNWSNTIAVRAHQLQKVCGIPWESPNWHFPQRYQLGYQPEAFIAVCRAG